MNFVRTNESCPALPPPAPSSRPRPIPPSILTPWWLIEQIIHMASDLARPVPSHLVLETGECLGHLATHPYHHVIAELRPQAEHVTVFRKHNGPTN